MLIQRCRSTRMFVTNTLTMLTFLSIVVLRANAQLSEGSACNRRGTSGTCKNLRKCIVVYNELLSGIRPEPSEFCGFDNHEPIVCCPNSNTGGTIRPPIDQSTQRSTMSPTTVSRPRPSQPREIARIKCREYSDQLYQTVQPPTLAANKPSVNVSTCELKLRKLIVGGQKADPKEFPHMAAIGFNDGGKIVWNCGGTLVSKDYVLTAAHCTYSNNFGSAIWVRLGDLNLASDTDNARPQTRRIARKIRHPNYKPPAEYHDIALLQLEEPVEFNTWVRPACLPTSIPEAEQNVAMATGWGTVEWTDETGPDELQKVTLKLVKHSVCNDAYSDTRSDGKLLRGIVEDWQLCAGELGKDTCQGDSGGPLAVYNTENNCLYNVIGVTSFGKLCGSIAPGVYTRVYHYVPWLENIIWANDF